MRIAISILLCLLAAPLWAHNATRECYDTRIESDGSAHLVPKLCPPEPAHTRTADRSWWLINTASWVSTVADIENTQYAIAHGAREGNPLYGSHPSRLRAYAIAAPIAGVTTWLSWRWKVQDDRDRATLGYTAKVRWYVAPLINIGTHGVGVGVTLALTGR